MGYGFGHRIALGRKSISAVSQPFLPIPSNGLKLWLKADAGVSTTPETFISAILITNAGSSTSNGNYTRASAGQFGTNSFSGPNGNSLIYNGDIDGWELNDPNLQYSYVSQIIISDCDVTTSNGTYTRNSPYVNFDGPNGNYIFGEDQQWYLWDTDVGYITSKNNEPNLDPASWTNSDDQPNATAVNSTSSWTGGISYINVGSVSLPEDAWYPNLGSAPITATNTNTIKPNGNLFVTGWADQSGNGNNALPDFAPRSPTFVASFLNGKPSIQFDGQIQVLDIADSASLNFLNTSIFVVLKRTGTGLNNETVFMKNGNPLDYNEAGMYWLQAKLFEGDSSCSVNVDGDFWDQGFDVDLGDGVPRIMNFSYNGTILATYVNGTQTAQYGNQNGNISTSAGTLQIGGYNKSFGAQEYFNGQIAEIIMYNRAISEEERQQVEAYLNTKYAVY